MKWFCAILLLHFSQILAQKCCHEAITVGDGYSNLTTAHLNTTDSLSLCVWVRPSKHENYHIVTYVDTEYDSRLLITTTQASLMGTIVSSYNSILNINSSNYLCITWGVEQGATMYFNGAEERKNTSIKFTSTPINFNGDWYIGQKLYFNESGGRRFGKGEGLVGSVCGLSIWSEVLSAEYINELYLNATVDKDEKEKKKDDVKYLKFVAPAVTWDNFTHTYTEFNDTFCVEDKIHGIQLGNLDPVASKFVILFLVIVGVIIGFGGLFMCSEREIANKRALKRTKLENHVSLDDSNASMP